MTLNKFPDADPSITLDFTKSKKLDPRITFSRASSAGPPPVVGEGSGNVNGQVYEFQENVPRLTDQGLLIEESRTNYITDNSTLTGWGANSGTAAVVASTTVCPDGSTDGIQITGTLASDGARKYFTAIAGAYIGSCYARSRTGSSQDVKVAFSGLVGPTQTLPASGEWVRIQSNSGVSIGAGSRYLLVAAVSAGTLDIDVWGEQVEIGSFPTSYIPTSGAEVTRAEDLCEITNDELSSWYNSSGGTYVTEFNSVGYGGTIPVYVNFIKGNTGRLEFHMDGTVYGYYNVATKWGNHSPALLSRVDNKTAMAHSWLTGEGGYSSNGIAPIVTAAIDPAPGPYDPTRMAFGFTLYQNRGYGVSGYIQRFSYYPTRLSNDALQALTTQQT